MLEHTEAPAAKGETPAPAAKGETQAVPGESPAAHAGVPAPEGAPSGGGGGQRRKAVVGRVASALLVLAGAGAVVAAGSAFAPLNSSRSVPPVQASVPAGASQGVCAGPARLLEGAEAGTDPQFSPESASAATSVTAAVLGAAGGLPPARLAGLNGKTAADLAKTGSKAPPKEDAQKLVAGALAARPVTAPSVLSADPLANQQASAAGAAKFSATDGDLQGTAAANCLPPSNDQWLAGASTTVGRTSVLVLTNVSATPATVNLELFGKAGQIQAPGSRGLLVAPNSTRSVVLAGLAPAEERLAVHVRSTGGPVAALIQQSTLRGLTPGGLDFIAPGAAPSVRQVMPGVDIQDPAGLGSLLENDGYGDAGPVLQLTVPGPSDAVVEVKLLGRDGEKALPRGGVVTAKAGVVTEVPLSGVPAGQYTVAASSDVSFVATARMGRGLKAGSPTDVAWAPSGVRLGSQHVVPVPPGGARRLVFGVLDTRATLTYAAITADGTVHNPQSADIAGGTTAAVTVPEKVEGSVVVGYVVSAAGDAAYGSVLMYGVDGRNDISALGFLPAAAGQETVPVTVGY